MQFLSIRAKTGGLWVMIAIFTPLVLALGWVVLDGFWWQDRAAEFPSATATVTKSEVHESRRSRRGRSYTLHLAYTFSADGRTHTATRLRYYPSSSSGRTAARELHAQYPVGRTVIAYYPPDAPELAVLEAGVQGTDWLRLMAATAATLLVAGLWGLALTRRPPFDPENPQWLAKTASGWEVRLPATTRRAVFIVGFAVAAAVAWFALTIRYGDNPEPEVVGAAFAVAVALAAAGAGLFAHYPVVSADLDAEELALPAPWLGEAVRVPFRGVSSVEVRWEEKTAGRNGRYTVYHCDVGWGANGRVGLTTVATFLEPAQAERLALWLRLNCGLAEREPAAAVN